MDLNADRLGSDAQRPAFFYASNRSISKIKYICNGEKTKNMSKKDDGKSFCCYNKGQQEVIRNEEKNNTGFFGDHIDFFSDLRRDPFYIY